MQSASGTVESNGTMRFAAKTWRVGATFCGTKMADYSLDRFEARLAAGAETSEATVSDDVVWTDGVEIDLTRVSCQ